MLVLPLQQFRDHCDESPDVMLLWCLTLSAIDSREQMFLMRVVIVRSVYNAPRSFVKTTGLSYSPHRSASSLKLHSLRLFLIHSTCSCLSHSAYWTLRHCGWRTEYMTRMNLIAICITLICYNDKTIYILRIKYVISIAGTLYRKCIRYTTYGCIYSLLIERTEETRGNVS